MTSDMVKIEKGDSEQAVFCLNPGIYPLKAVYGACYAFLDRAYIFLDGDPEKEIRVTMKAKGEPAESHLEAIVGEFSNELLNCALRNGIAKDNLKIREYIIGQALASTVDIPKGQIPGLEDMPGADADFKEDPLGIAVPWEEKQEEADASGKEPEKESK